MLTTLEQHRSKISENIGILRRTLDTFPRVRLGHLPTPLEPMRSEERREGRVSMSV